jgi:hypothetical protein
MKYTLIALKTTSYDFVPAGHQSSPTPFVQVLELTAKHRVDICEGVYIFETQPGWRDIHLLRKFLVEESKQFVELQFEEGLAGFLSRAIRDKLRDIGLSDASFFSLSE